MSRIVSVVCIAVSAIAPFTAAAQTGTIAGTVRDAMTRAPIEGASVRIDGLALTATTSPTGAFTLLDVPVGTYTVAARRHGFATLELMGVDVQAGRTQTVSFLLRAATADSVERVAFDSVLAGTPVGSAPLTLNREQLSVVPTLSLAGVFGVNGGYVQLPRSAANISLTEVNRAIVELSSIRGARPAATQYTVDGVSVRNPVFGSPPILLEPLATAGVTVTPAHVDAEYGGALAGLVEQSARAGGARTRGTAEMLTASVPGKLGSRVSAASDAYVVRGYLAGPVPVAPPGVHYMIAGHVHGERVAVLDGGERTWGGVGETRQRQLVAKLTYAARPSVRLSLLGLTQRRAAAGFDPSVLTGDSVAPPVVRDDARFVVLRAEKRLSRATVSMSAARTTGDRETCSIWQGVCVRDRLARIPLDSSERPVFGIPPVRPYVATGQYYGGERYVTNTLRADFAAQPSDGHQLRVGVYATQHDLRYADVMGYRYLQGDVLKAVNVYRARPREFATYVQDAITHDLITVRLGLRYEHTNTGGVMFVDPLNPTNGTTVREVCDGNAPGLNETPFTYGPFSGVAACLNAPGSGFGRSGLLDSATRIAQRDDMRRVRPSGTFAPRIAVSFPTTERSTMFFNVGRFHRAPLYHNAFRNTGAGSHAGFERGDDGMCDERYSRPGTDECAPNLTLPREIPEFVGNPGLTPELGTVIEAGFSTLIGRGKSLEASFFNTSHGYLARLYQLTLAPDIGVTYGVLSRGTQRTVLSRGSATSLGVSVTVRRRRERIVMYMANYTWQKSQEIGATPDLVAEALVQAEPSADEIERLSSRGHAHTLSGMFGMQWGAHTRPPFGALGAIVLANSRTTVTGVAAGGGAQAQQPAACLFTTNRCAAFEQGPTNVQLFANLLYVRTLTTGGAHTALVVRVRNVLDADDGATELRRRRVGGALAGVNPRERISQRRILAGFSVDF